MKTHEILEAVAQKEKEVGQRNPKRFPVIWADQASIDEFCSEIDEHGKAPGEDGAPNWTPPPLKDRGQKAHLCSWPIFLSEESGWRVEFQAEDPLGA